MRGVPNKSSERAMEILSHHMVHVLRDDMPSARRCGMGGAGRGTLMFKPNPPA